jgi:cyclase
MTIKNFTRRDLLKGAGALGGAAVAARLFSPSVANAFFARQSRPPSIDALAVMRAQMAATPIQVTRVTNVITMLSGPGGNVLVREGPEGKAVVDTFVQGAFPALKQHIDAIGPTPVVLVINTHWHFDHTDNIESFRNMGAEVVAHENTRRRLLESHELLGLKFTPVPTAALPTRTFGRTHEAKFGTTLEEEFIDIEHVPRAHTDTDVLVRFTLGDVVHLGDIFVNGAYPFIDVGTGGSITGMIAAADKAIRMTNPQTRIVPGHGPLADLAALVKYRDMLATVGDRVQRLKTAGRTEQEVVAAKPTAELDATWGQGSTKPDSFVSFVYNTL